MRKHKKPNPSASWVCLGKGTIWLHVPITGFIPPAYYSCIVNKTNFRKCFENVYRTL